MIRPAPALSIFVSLAMLPAAAAAQTCAGTQTGGAVRLAVATTDVHNSRGEVAVTLYPDDRQRFLSKGGKLLRVRIPAAQGTTQACFWVPPGNYAVAVYHDENGDHSFNRTLWAPKEGYGFSNDAPTTFGLPSFAATRFAVPASGRTIAIRMRYGRG